MTDTVCYSLACSEYRALFGESVKAEMARTLAVRRSADEPGGASEIRATDLNGIRMLGQGSYGKAMLVQDQEGKLYVMKTIDMSAMDKKQRRDAINEVRVLSCLKHPYMSAFVTGTEPPCPGKLSIPIDDDYKFTVNDYREKLYQQVVAKIGRAHV